jgi:O-antigen/teichoic acid export membrane protein
MESPARLRKTVAGIWLTDSVILTAANLIGAIANYLFQAIMRRHLSWSEFGYLNTTIGLIMFAGVPLTAASQTVTHHLALIGATGDTERMQRLQATSLKFLRHLTWILFAASLVLLYPIADYLHFPRMSLAWVALLWIPINLWSTLGGAWCAGLSRFRLYAFLLILTGVVRLVAGDLLVRLYPWAESGIAGCILSGLVLALVVAISPHHGTEARLRQSIFDRDLIVYGVAALAVSFSAFVFLQGDQIIAQRHFPGVELGRYSGAGLLGRAIVWASLPVLIVYFTRRSGHDPAHKSPAHLLWAYLGLIGTGAVFLIIFKVPMLYLLLGTHDAGLADMTTQFALTMVPIGVLQALGYHYLAARRIPECMVFGVCGLAYLTALIVFGDTPSLMLGWMGGMASASILVLGVLALFRRRSPSLQPVP